MNYPDDFVGKVVCGNCMDVLKEIPEGVIDLVTTDPPYNIGRGSPINLEGREVGTDWSHYEFEIYPKDWVPLVARVLKDTGVLISFYADKTYEQLSVPIKEHLTWVQGGIWHKTNPTPALRGVGFQHATEPFIIARKGEHHYFNTELGQRHNVLEYPTVTGSDRTPHPNQKPLALFKELIARFSKPGDVVLDPFIGSGTAAVAAKWLGRKFIGIDINTDYLEIDEKRLGQEVLQLEII